MKLRVLPYKPYSQSAKALVNALGRNRAILKKNNTAAINRTTILNWGNSQPGFNYSQVRMINKPDAVAKASNKKIALDVMKLAEVSVPDFTTSLEMAQEWIEEGYMVVCRKLLRSNSGKGIVLAKTALELVTAPLYTKYLRKGTEFRVHVFNGQVIDYVQKKRKSGQEDAPEVNKYIKSYNNGWVMCRDGVTQNPLVTQEAIKAATALGLDFGAVDLVLQTKNDVTKVYVLEVNTAPGITNTTLQAYVNAIRRNGYAI